MSQCENGLLALPKILPAEDDGTGMLDWVCTIQYRGADNCVGLFSLFFEHMTDEKVLNFQLSTCITRCPCPWPHRKYIALSNTAKLPNAFPVGNASN